MGLIQDGTNLFATDICDKSTYRFPATGGAASVATVVRNRLNRGLTRAHGLYYATTNALPTPGVYSFDPATLAVGHLIASFPQTPYGLVGDPLSNDLYVATGAGIWRVQNPDTSPVVTHVVTGADFDGIQISADGRHIWTANRNLDAVQEYGRPGPTTLPLLASVHVGRGVDGIAIARSTAPGGVAGNVFVNDNDGTIVRIDTNNDNALSVVAAGGSRGDFATVGPDGCLYATQSDRVLKLAPCFFQDPTADLSVAASASPNPAMILFPFSYRLVVANAGPSMATAVTLTQNLPPQVHLASTSASQGSCTGSNGAIVCSLGSLAPGASSTVTVDVTAPLLPTCVTSSASVTGSQSDPNLANNSTSLTTQVSLLRIPLLGGACPGPAPTPAPTNSTSPTPAPSTSPVPPAPSTSPVPPGPTPSPSPSPTPTRSARVLPLIEGQTPSPPPPSGPGGLPGSPWAAGAIALAVGGSAAVGLVTTGAASTALLGVGRWRRAWRFGGDASFASAPPPAHFDLARAAGAALPQQRPANARDLLARRDYYRVPDAPEPFRHAALWTLALNDAIRRRGGIGRRLLGVRKTTIGFVEAGGRVRLAAIFYVRLPALAQAAPLFVTVDGQRFPVVIRPMFKDRPLRAPSKTRLHLDTGMVTCRVRLGGKAGILTAAHVAARDGDKRSLRENDTVSFSEPGEQAPLPHRVLRADPIMDAAVVEEESPAPEAHGVHAYPFVGYFPIEMRSPEGSVVGGHVVEMEVPQGVVPGAPGQSPSDPAVLLIDVTGQPGWSGSMVWEATYRESPEYASGPRPYGMFVGVRKVYTATLGRVHMLTQIEKVWQLELLED